MTRLVPAFRRRSARRKALRLARALASLDARERAGRPAQGRAARLSVGVAR